MLWGITFAVCFATENGGNTSCICDENIEDIGRKVGNLDLFHGLFSLFLSLTFCEDSHSNFNYNISDHGTCISLYYM